MGSIRALLLVGYVRKITYLANVMVGGEKATTGNLGDASLILQVKLDDYAIYNSSNTKQGFQDIFDGLDVASFKSCQVNHQPCL